MKEWHETTGHTLGIGVRSAGIRQSRSKNKKNSLLQLIIPAPLTAPNHLTLSAISLADFLVNSVEDGRTLCEFKFLKGQLNSQSLLCHNHLSYLPEGLCMSSSDMFWATGITWIKLEPLDSSSRVGIASLHL